MRNHHHRIRACHALLLVFVMSLPTAWSADIASNQADNDVFNLDDTYRRAASGDIDAQFQLFKVYRQGVADTERDVEKAKRWLQSAAQSGHSEAQYWLGHIYFFGSGVERDVDSGMHWYRKSASQGFIHAQLALGAIYNGWRYRFYPSNPAEALVWYGKAAEQGHIQSILIVGCSDYFGINHITDVAAGLTWFQKAEQQGDDTATAYLKMDNSEDLRLFCERVARM